MEIIGTNFEEEQKKNKKLMSIITAFIVLLLIISIILGLAIYYLKSKQFKFVVDGSAISKYSSDLFKYQNEEVYVSLRDIAPIVGYEYKNGAYKQYTEDTNKCYLECENEVVTLERDSDKIYKTVPEELDYTYYTLNEPIKRLEGKLYINSKDLGIVCNLQMEYDAEANSITIVTLPYIVDYYTSYYSNSSLTSSFNNQKALLYGLMVVQSIDNTAKDQNEREIRYGVNNLNNEEIVGMKYKKIEFVEGTQELIVTTPEDLVGIITKDGDTKVKPEYEALKQIDKDKNLYLATINNKNGIIENNGKKLIYPEYDQIGVDTTQFPANDIKNKYILFDNAIPVLRDKKWGLYDIDGKQILALEYDSMGCVSRTSSDKSFNNILIIPEIEGIVVGKDYEVDTSNKVTYYGVVSSTGKELIPTWMETIYSTVNSGQVTYTMKNMGNSIDLIDYIRENGILDSEEINNSQNEQQNTVNQNTIDNTLNNNQTNSTENYIVLDNNNSNDANSNLNNNGQSVSNQGQNDRLEESDDQVLFYDLQ